MFQFFDAILGFIETLWGFISSFFNAIAFAVSALVTSLALPFALIDYVPVIIGASISIFISVYLVKFLLGR